MSSRKSVVLLSGGLDSATVLLIAMAQGFECYALSINYGQRATAELDAAKKLSKHYHVDNHRLIDVTMNQFGGSALTDASLSIPHEMVTTEIPITYVPARNTILLSLALGFAETIGAFDIFYGANSIDYSNYPDCRSEYIRAFEQLACLATKAGVEGHKFTIHAPLINMSKEEIILRGIALGLDYSLTVSCYDPDPHGLACGQCASCQLRAKGFQQAGVTDPTRYFC